MSIAVESVDWQPLQSVGQVQPGDLVRATFKGKTQPYVVAFVLNPGTDQEEIVLDAESNLYYITSMALDGTSWAKDVMVEGGSAQD